MLTPNAIGAPSLRRHNPRLVWRNAKAEHGSWVSTGPNQAVDPTSWNRRPNPKTWVIIGRRQSMYALIITILVYATGGQILSASTTSVLGYTLGPPAMRCRHA